LEGYFLRPDRIDGHVRIDVGQERWWPEKGERQAIWASAETAARFVYKAEPRRLIIRFAARTDKGAGGLKHFGQRLTWVKPPAMDHR
jgi:hypothetical protein